jgi:alkanesulfonate monooxygenase SsuD/methylene tetrahydromethanopterin reductase-like flavin-dependent oxidoreductase (luciferase family)
MIVRMATPFTFLAGAPSARELGEQARAAEDLGVTTYWTAWES